MLNIDFADISDLGRRHNAHGMHSPGEAGLADGGENVRPVMLSMMAPLLFSYIYFSSITVTLGKHYEP